MTNKETTALTSKEISALTGKETQALTNNEITALTAEEFQAIAFPSKYTTPGTYLIHHPRTRRWLAFNIKGHFNNDELYVTSNNWIIVAGPMDKELAETIAKDRYGETVDA